MKKKNPQDKYTGSIKGENYIYGAAMNLAWNEMNENVIHGNLILETESRDALRTVKLFNNAPFSVNDLDAESCYVRSGFGPETQQRINLEMKEKFPKKSFTDLNYRIGQSDLIVYSYLFKRVEYLHPFKTMNTLFMGRLVKGFMNDSGQENQRTNVIVADYQHDDQFLIQLKLKNDQDQLFLLKGWDSSSPEEIVDEINRLDIHAESSPVMGWQDNFQMPRISFSHTRIYNELLGLPILNNDLKGYTIGRMAENIKFEIDETGARAENDGVMQAQRMSPVNTRNFFLNKPFWIVMKRKKSLNPYFIIHITNEEFMEKL
jgi:hypothetical protein